MSYSEDDIAEFQTIKYHSTPNLRTTTSWSDHASSEEYSSSNDYSDSEQEEYNNAEFDPCHPSRSIYPDTSESEEITVTDQELASRIKTRAYYLWQNTGQSDQTRNYYQAQKEEIDQESYRRLIFEQGFTCALCGSDELNLGDWKMMNCEHLIHLSCYQEDRVLYCIPCLQVGKVTKIE